MQFANETVNKTESHDMKEFKIRLTFTVIMCHPVIKLKYTVVQAWPNF